jgi:hypothetical protein
MLKERGVSTLVAVVIIGIAVVGVSIFSYYILSSKKSIDVARKSAAKADGDAPDEIPADSPATQSLISFDPFVYTSPTAVYYRTLTPAPLSATEGSPVEATKGLHAGTAGTYLRIEGADPITFSEIKKIPIKNPTTADSGATTNATYYRDSDQIFIAQTTVHQSGDAETSVSVVTADPATFQILNDTYAKDATHVFIVSWVCEGETCTLVLVVVPGADPATFHVIDETVVQKSDGSGTVTADAVDSTHLFNNGVIVDTVVTPGSNETDMTPVLISP